jgi:DNA-binding transcriptional regulator YiaG
MPTASRPIRRNAQGYRIGETHHRARHSDATVERARKLREEDRLSYQAIGLLLGVPWRTVADWVNYRIR